MGASPQTGSGPSVRAIDDPMRAAGAAGKSVHTRLQVLDGWRAISILLVLAGHMLPLGPKPWQLNGTVATLGMAIFFTLSGFLIVSILIRDQNIAAFLLKRFARIVPLAWLTLAIVLTLDQATGAEWLANLFFYANLPPFYLQHGGHFWSLGVEMQFYVCIACVILFMGRRGLLLVPLTAAAVTGLRIASGTEISIVTWLRIDEILAGGILALVVHGSPDGRARRYLTTMPFCPVALLFLASAHPKLEVLNFARPYLGAVMVGVTILRPITWLTPLLMSRWAAYVAKTSYAVYVFHPYSMVGWLGSGTGAEKYLKRPICLALTFGMAHLSTFRFEGPINAWAHRLADGPLFRQTGAAASVLQMWLRTAYQPLAEAPRGGRSDDATPQPPDPAQDARASTSTAAAMSSRRPA
jgi:peptidoglycan/LPS O-acetylase OafA/YrhL